MARRFVNLLNLLASDSVLAGNWINRSLPVERLRIGIAIIRRLVKESTTFAKIASILATTALLG
jgi:hypothetical protein